MQTGEGFTMEFEDKIITKIALFARLARENKMVETVYFTCFKGICDTSIEVTAIYNKSLKYEKLMGSQVSESDLPVLQSLIADYNEKSESLDGKVLRFKADSSGYYSKFMEEQREAMALKSLISGNIMFDRFGRFYKLKEEMIQSGLQPFKDTLDKETQNDVMVNKLCKF